MMILITKIKKRITFLKKFATIYSQIPLENQVWILNELDSSLLDEIDQNLEYFNLIFESCKNKVVNQENSTQVLMKYDDVINGISQTRKALKFIHQSDSFDSKKLTCHPQITERVQNLQSDAQFTREFFNDLIYDRKIIDCLLNSHKQWSNAVKELANSESNFNPISVRDEITHWFNHQNKVKKIIDFFSRRDVEASFFILACLKKVSSSNMYDFKLCLSRINSKLADYQYLFKDFPIETLWNANTLTEISDCLDLQFKQLFRIKNNRYPKKRFLKFLQMLSRELNHKIIEVL